MIKRRKTADEVAPHVRPAHAATALLALLIELSVLARSRPEPALLKSIVDDAIRRLQ